MTGGVINGELAYGWNSFSISAEVDDYQKGLHLLAGIILQALQAPAITRLQY